MTYCPLFSTLPRWSTASLPNRGQEENFDSVCLVAHLRACRSSDGNPRRLRVAIEALCNFVAPRLVTTAVLLATTISVAAAFV